MRRGAKPRGGHAVSGRRLDSILSIVEWMRVDAVAILVMVLLPELGLVRATDTFSGLSSNAVVEKVCELKDLRQWRHVNRWIRWGATRRVKKPIFL